MTEGELLRQLDRHLERGNELMAHNTEAFERLSARLDDDRDFMRELILRSEQSERRLTVAVERRTAEIVEELRAQRGALFRMLDRLDPGGPNATA